MKTSTIINFYRRLITKPLANENHDINRRIRHQAAKVMLCARNVTGGYCAVSGTEFDAVLTTENLKLLERAVDDYDALIVQLARETTNQPKGA